jgi:6-phosphogluconolactonase (cycloisomerase 2 family)
MRMNLLRAGLTVVGMGVTAGLAWAQASEPVVFVANNGNLEGSVTSFRLGPSNEPVFIAKTVIEARSSSGGGTNAAQAALSPDGRFLAVSHTTAQTAFEQITILRVNADGTTTVARTFQTPDSPLGLAWLGNDRLAATITRTSGVNSVVLYAFDGVALTLTEVDREDAGAFCSDIEAHPSGRFLYANDTSGGLNIRVFELNAGGTLDLIQTVSTAPRFAIGLGINNAGDRLYAGGGISDGRNKVLAYSIGCDGRLAEVAGQPFLSPGNSPKQAVTSWDDSIVFAGHGTDSSVRSLLVDPITSALTPTAFAFSVGIQGTLGDIAATRGLLFILDRDTSGGRGLYSYSILPNGNFTRNGTLVDSQGSTPSFLAVWWPCRADLNGDRVVDFNDLLEYLNIYNNGSLRADLNRDCVVDFNDLLEFLNQYNAAC